MIRKHWCGFIEVLFWSNGVISRWFPIWKLSFEFILIRIAWQNRSLFLSRLISASHLYHKGSGLLILTLSYLISRWQETHELFVGLFELSFLWMLYLILTDIFFRLLQNGRQCSNFNRCWGEKNISILFGLIIAHRLKWLLPFMLLVWKNVLVEYLITHGCWECSDLLVLSDLFIFLINIFTFFKRHQTFLSLCPWHSCIFKIYSLSFNIVFIGIINVNFRQVVVT